MEKFIRILVAVGVLTAVAFVAPSPASATHGTDQAVTPTVSTDDDNNPTGGTHEGQPAPAVATPAIPCAVEGNVLVGTPGNSEPHTIPPAGNNASHSHFKFEDAFIACSDTLQIAIRSDGGNDGHLIDLDDQTTPHPTANNAAGRSHHGSTNESGWSHSSGFSNPTITNTVCTTANNANKADVAAGPVLNETKGWLKYLRVGVVLYVWGCFDAGNGGPIAANPAFSAVLAIFPPSLNPFPPAIPNYPLCLVPPNMVTAPADCGFSIAGVAYRGPGFSV